MNHKGTKAQREGAAGEGLRGLKVSGFEGFGDSGIGFWAAQWMRREFPKR